MLWSLEVVWYVPHLDAWKMPANQRNRFLFQDHPWTHSPLRMHPRVWPNRRASRGWTRHGVVPSGAVIATVRASIAHFG